ncbi:hypothetical protein V499_01186 [Pseudogymnoascus sp. VKM F-103]|uniref:RGS domain-containing protein n=1 Tax=Pseudogymnoascus verrucosus TaxID=342668 RepID=A0A1B8GBK9_9PEZI|nr:uncharacterized protein VE01_09228 [Pseudogymnoascus verrucosus]KFY79881.1 hypothetical protein V499_01186 [Pseudogymnoascus sp. VKM F-103]OBT93167.1 hypothetical protein VE01_09228 [Pseudogymnoascus verrucosus]
MPPKKHLPSRPLSLAIPVKRYSPRRPTLQEILANSAPPPWTLSAFTAYLSQNHCLENLEFTMDATLYRKQYEALLANCGEETIMASTEGCEYVRMLWQKLLDAYITPNGPREVNIPGDVRDRLLSSPNHFRPPSPLQLDSAIMVVYELMDESVLVSFLNSVSRGFSNYTGPWTSVEDTSVIPTPDSPPMPPAASTRIGYGSTSSSGPSRDAQTSNSAHSHQPVQRSHLAAALKRGVKFIYPSPSSNSAKENNDSLIKYTISAGSSSSLGEFMIPLIIPPTYNSFTDTSESSSKVSRAGESDSKKMGWKLGLGLRKP